MHVCFLLDGEFSSSRRARKHATAFREAGHAVTVCCRGTGDESEQEIVEGIDVRRLPDESLYSGIRGKLDGVRYALRFVQPAWVRTASEVDDERAVDVCCVADLSLVKTGLKIGTRLDVPVVCDLPSASVAVRAASRGGRVRGIVRRVFHLSWRRNRLITNSLPDADRLVTTCEEARAEYVRERGLDSRNVTVVRDTTAVSPIDPDIDRELGFDPDEAFVVTAFADDTEMEELETLVEAAARAADAVVSLHLVVVGDIEEETRDGLETLARRRLAGGRVTFRIEAPTPADAAASDVCVFPPVSGAPETSTLPELFEAMAFGVPVVVADTPPLRRIVTRTNAGRVVSGGRPELTEALVSLADAETATELGANGRAAVEREFNWERDADRLRAIYESVFEDSRSEEVTENSRISSVFTALSDRIPL